MHFWIAQVKREKNSMKEDASLTNDKFSFAETVSDYILKKEKAGIMKMHARHLYSITDQLTIEETHG